MRKLVLSLPVCLLAIATAAAQDRDFSKVEIKVQKVSGSVYMLQGAGGNIGASVGEDGIVIVDDEYAPLAEKIQAALKGITDKPVRFIINTHYHGDHTGSNAILQEKAPVIAQDNVRKRLATGGLAGNGGSVRMDNKPADPKALPIITFDHDVTVHLNGEDIRALHFPHGHTDGDSVIYFPKSNVVHMGDDFVTYGFPFIDLDAGGSVQGLIADIEEILPKLPPDVKLIPGHGPVSNVDDLKNFLAMVKESVAAVQSAKQAGKSVEQMKKDNIMAPYAKYSGEFVNADKWIETIYNDLSGKPGEFIRHN
jgi:cyclase